MDLLLGQSHPMGFQSDLMEPPHCIQLNGPSMRTVNPKIGRSEMMGAHCQLAQLVGPSMMMASQLDLMGHRCQRRMVFQLRLVVLH
jgi:hypothetical protein